ncbi:hypothetical protein AGMMS4956_16450 [Bacteroidia bacterium]|nr:hypothetical protein AGMMS4956_16450 [Bacteroidia bacterium]
MVSGPIPAPDVLAKYDVIIPGAAERILRMAEKEAAVRHSNNITISNHAIKLAKLGVMFAFISVLMMCGLVFYALWRGFDVVAGSIAVGAIASVASVFILFRAKQNRQ